MYAATVDTLRLSFQASGSLWQDALVMQDLETKSLWSQVSGEAIRGPMEGKTLQLIPATHTTYAEFKRLYPEGVLLEKPQKGPAGSPYQKYFADKTRLGMFGRVDNFKRLDGKARVYGVRLPQGDMAVSEAYLKANQYALSQIADRDVIVTYDVRGGTVAAYTFAGLPGTNPEDISVQNDRILWQSGEERIVWHAQTGQVIEGEAVDLSPVPVVTAYWFAWVSFFPETELIY